MKRIYFALVLALGVVVHPHVVSTQPTPRTYLLAEGATGPFFDTDILLANPQSTNVPVTLTFFKEDGTTVAQDVNLTATSRTTIRVDNIAGLEATAFSTLVTSPSGAEVIVERTMRWDTSGYGAHTEKATAGAATEWFFAEGSQGFFFTYLLLVNPQSTPNVAHVTFLREGAPPIVRDYALLPSSRRTIVAGEEAELVNTSFGARVRFDSPGVAERAMYFGLNPLFTGGHESAGVTAPSTNWFLAEGATGSFFATFVLLANPNDQEAHATVTYLPSTGAPIVKQVTIPGGQRVTRDISGEDPALASAAVGARIESDLPIIVERAQYWPNPAPNWYEAHNSFGLTTTGLRWGLAEGSVGGTRSDQTYILLANPGTVASDVRMTFLRTNGTTVVKDFNVPATSRVNIAVAGAGSHVPELANETFGVIIDASQPIAVERSVYGNVGGLTWAAGTNATATPLSPPQPLTVNVNATDANASEVGPDTGTFTFTRTGGTTATALSVFFTVGGTAANGSDYQTIGGSISIPANQSSTTITITPHQDNNNEGAETATVTLVANVAYAIGASNTATVTVADSVATVNVEATDGNAAEAGPDSGTFTFTRAGGGNQSQALNVFFTVGGSAANGTDYQTIGGSVSIPANQLSTTIIITPHQDNNNEGSENVTIALVANNAYTLGASTTAGVSIADSVTTVTVQATDGAAAEAGPDIGTFTFTRSAGGNQAQALNVFFTVGGGAANGTDYQTIGGSISIPANQLSTTITITPHQDNNTEGDENVTIALVANNAYILGASTTAGVTITDSVTTVTVAATDPNASETGPDTGTFTFTRSAGGNQAQALNVFFTVGGTAANGTDYQTIGGSISIPANQNSVTLTITPHVNAPAEAAETVTITLTPNNAYIVGTAGAVTVTIVD